MTNRVRVEYGGAGAQVAIRQWGHWFGPLIVTAFVFGWIFFQGSAGHDLHIPAWPMFRPLISVLLPTAAILLWLWTYFGERVIRVEAGAFVLRDQMFGIGLSREFEIAGVKNLRERYKPASRNEIGAREYTVNFDYGAKTFTVAEFSDPNEAAALLDLMRQTLPLP